MLLAISHTFHQDFNTIFLFTLLNQKTDNGSVDSNDGMQMSMMTLMVGWIVLAMILYFLRPSSLRNKKVEKKRPNDQDRGDRGDRGDEDHQSVL